MKSRWYFILGGVVVISALGVSCAPKIENHKLIDSEYNGRELQIEIWKHLENGELSQAYKIRDQVIHTLSKGQCNLGDRNIGGLSRPRLLECDHGIKAVFKVKNIPYPQEEVTAERESFNHLDEFHTYPLSDANSEISAYLIDELLDMHLVPITVSRFIPGVGKGSVQYFVRGGKDGGGDHSSPGYLRLKILDFIIQNEDRWEGNWLFHLHENRIIAIDQGRSFVRVQQPANPILTLPEVLDALRSDSHLNVQIKQVNVDSFYPLLKGYLRTEYIQGVQNRIREIQNGLPASP